MENLLNKIFHKSGRAEILDLLFWTQGLSRICIRCLICDFKDLGCPKYLIERVKIITLIMYINKKIIISLILQEMSLFLL